MIFLKSVLVFGFTVVLILAVLASLMETLGLILVLLIDRFEMAGFTVILIFDLE